MNKLGIVLGVTAVAVVSGCMDPQYQLPGHLRTQGEAVQVGPSESDLPGAEADPGVAGPVPGVAEIETTDVPVCTCPPGTKHAVPCACGASDCECIVEEPLPPPPPPAPAVETTTYIVQRGDTLSKISKKFNIKMDAIRKANPQLKGDNIRIGQKLQLPGKVEVGEQLPPPKPKAPAAPAYKPYTGETKEYIVVKGDSLGKIAYSNGINIRQLKELNGLSSNTIRIGQKLKIPASRPAPAAAASRPLPPPPPPKPADSVKPAPAKVEAAPVVAPVQAVPVQPAEPVVEEPIVLLPDVPAPVAPVAPAEPAVVEPEAAPEAPAAVLPPPADVEESITYVVQEGEDIAGVAVTFGVDSSVIRKLNNLGSDEQLKPGQVIKIPASAL